MLQTATTAEGGFSVHVLKSHISPWEPRPQTRLHFIGYYILTNFSNSLFSLWVKESTLLWPSFKCSVAATDTIFHTIILSQQTFMFTTFSPHVYCSSRNGQIYCNTDRLILYALACVFFGTRCIYSCWEKRISNTYHNFVEVLNGQVKGNSSQNISYLKKKGIDRL